MSASITRRRYPSDLTDAPWEILAPLIPEASPNATQETIPRREIVNGILSVLRTGCSWRQMPHDLPHGKTVYHYFRHWKLDGTWQRAMTALRKEVRRSIGREEERKSRPSSTESLSRPVRCVEASLASTREKKIWGRKRHLLVDTQGFPLAVKVHTAGISDREGARLLLGALQGGFPRMRHLFADHGYTGPLTDADQRASALGDRNCSQANQ